jgi:hypothetical protein
MMSTRVLSLGTTRKDATFKVNARAGANEEVAVPLTVPLSLSYRASTILLLLRCRL